MILLFCRRVWTMESQLHEIFSAITEHYDSPLRLGSRCESKYYYRVEDLRFEDLQLCSKFLQDRVLNIGDIELPRFVITLPGSYTGLSEILCKGFVDDGADCDLIDFRDIGNIDEVDEMIKGAPVVLVNDVITTARSCLEAHGKITMLGAKVSSWVCLIDRTLGPGPVPVVAAHTGRPVTLLGELL